MAPASKGSLDAARDALVGIGMEDVQVRVDDAPSGGRALVAAFENRRYTLCDQDCLPEALGVLSRNAGDGIMRPTCHEI